MQDLIIKLQPLEDENKRALVMQRHHFSFKMN